jgi:hypothetical protein
VWAICSIAGPAALAERLHFSMLPNMAENRLGFSSQNGPLCSWKCLLTF